MPAPSSHHKHALRWRWDGDLRAEEGCGRSTGRSGSAGGALHDAEQARPGCRRLSLRLSLRLRLRLRLSLRVILSLSRSPRPSLSLFLPLSLLLTLTRLAQAVDAMDAGVPLLLEQLAQQVTLTLTLPSTARATDY